LIGHLSAPGREESEKATRILKGILDARSPRISDISHAMEGSSEANYKATQRFLDSSDPKRALQRLYWEQTLFVIGDHIERYQARKYVGNSSKTIEDELRGIWNTTGLLVSSGNYWPGSLWFWIGSL